MRKEVILAAVMFLVCSLVVPCVMLSADKVVYVADPRAHIVGTDTSQTYGLVHNFMNYDPAVEETIKVMSGSSVFFYTGPQTDDGGPPMKGCEAVWYKDAPTSSAGFQFILWDTTDPFNPVGIDTSSQTWEHKGPGRGKLNCKDNGQVKIKETYSGPVGQKFKRRMEVTTVVIQGTLANPDTTASVVDNQNFVVEIVLQQ